MSKNKFIVLSLILLFTLLTGCGPYISISGQVVDQHGHSVKGIKVAINGTIEETDSLGRYSISIPNVESSKKVNVTFDGLYLGFESKTRTIEVYKGQDYPMGKVELSRIKASIEGHVNMPVNYSDSTATPTSTPVNLPVMQKKQYVPGEVIVKFKNAIKPGAAKMLSDKMDVQILSTSPKGNFATIKTTDQIEKTIASLEKRQDVEYAEPNYYVYPMSVAKSTAKPQNTTTHNLSAQNLTAQSPTAQNITVQNITPKNTRPMSFYDDTYFDDQWNMHAINMQNAWERYYGDSDVTVAVLDTGIKKGHMDLDDNILWDLGKDFVDDDDDPSEGWIAHGTYVASIIGAIPDNGTGIAGINHNVSIVPIKILKSVNNDEAWGTTEDLIAGLEYAIYDADVDIINLSIAVNVSGSDNVRAIADLLDEAEDRDILVVAAAGNQNESEPDFPASYPSVLSVGAVGPTLQPASYTNHGVDIYAPGGDYYLYPVSNKNCIRALSPNGVDWVQGTSIASAHAAGVAALILSHTPGLSAASIRYRMMNSSLDLAYESDEHAGLLDAWRAIENENHARIFVFLGRESFDQFTYNTEESTYSYVQDNENYFRLANVEPGSSRYIFAWVDSDNDGALSDNDLFAKRLLQIDEGDEIDLELNLAYY